MKSLALRLTLLGLFVAAAGVAAYCCMDLGVADPPGCARARRIRCVRCCAPSATCWNCGAPSRATSPPDRAINSGHRRWTAASPGSERR